MPLLFGVRVPGIIEDGRSGLGVCGDRRRNQAPALIREPFYENLSPDQARGQDLSTL